MDLIDGRIRSFVIPQRIVWQSGEPRNTEVLLRPGSGQATIWSHPGAFLPPGASLLLDYGRELHGGVQVISGRSATSFADERVLRVRIRFGESVSEAMGEPNNDHAVHDAAVGIAAMGATEFGGTGFRFVRIDNLEAERTLEIRELRAVSLCRDLQQIASFTSDDPLLDRIWQTGAYTTQLCLQDYLWDGIKRDRLVWAGDLHPEVMVAATVFGKLDVVERSLDLLRDETPAPRFMNGFSSYSLTWILCHDAWFRFHGDHRYLEEQRPYLRGLLERFLAMLAADGAERIDARGRIIDWAFVGKETELAGGFHALLALALEAGARLCTALGEETCARDCLAAVAGLRRHVPPAVGAKSVNALQALAGIRDPAATNRDRLAVDPLRGMATFPGYYVLEARALADDHRGALDLIRGYWGGMLSLGATTFWEHFDVSWLENAGRIDELPDAERIDVHRTRGAGCFTGWRHSLCHGWAAGPTAWLSAHILGVRPVGAGRYVVEPHLAGLGRVSGRFPTPHGPLEVVCRRRDDGTTHVDCSAPDGVQVEVRNALA